MEKTILRKCSLSKSSVVKEYKQEIENLKEENEKLAKKIRKSNRRERLATGKAKKLGLID
jgi:cell division protein FtsB